MKKKIVLIILITVVMLSGCKSLFTREGNLLSDAKQAERRGDYHAAVLSVVESIRIDNEYKKAIEFLKEVYPQANSYYALKVDQTRSAGGESANDDIAMYYKYLKEINEAVRTLPTIYDPKTELQLTFTYTDYQKELEQANQSAAEEHYLLGLEYLDMKGRENGKTAVEEFEKTLSYIPGYKDAESLKMEAHKQALQIIAFFPFQNNAWNIPTAQFADIMQGTTISALMSNSGVMKYTQIIDQSLQARIIEQQAGSLSALMDDDSRVEIGQLLNSNIFITGTIDSAAIEGPNTGMTKIHRTAEIKVEQTETDSSSGTDYYKDGSSSLKYDSENDNAYYKSGSSRDTSSDVTAYGTITVEADVFKYLKEISFEVTVSYKAIDVETGAIIKSDTIKTLIEDSSEWAEWTGNEDALTYEDEQLIGKYEESVMSAQQIATRAAEQVGKDMANSLAAFLK